MNGEELVRAIQASGTADHCWHIEAVGEIVQATVHPASQDCVICRATPDRPALEGAEGKETP
jgi:hypothetical protein